MGSVRKYAAAEQDLFEIGVYIAQDSPTNAERFIDAIESECQKLANANFVLGRRCEGLHPELRRHNFKRYAIVYRPLSDGIELVGVFTAAASWRRCSNGSMTEPFPTERLLRDSG